MAYLGRAPNTGVRTRFIFTATASQTTFSGADDNGVTLKYEDAAYVDVFLNGVLLIPVTDYAATTKTSVVLTSGAAVSDIVEIVAYDIANIADTVSKANGGTFDGDVTFNGAFTSQGIDDNADATAMTIDSSENVLVGTTTRTNLSNGTGNTGHSLDNAGQARHTADSGEVMFLNRLTDDGDIAVFRKDGTTVGSIGTVASEVYIGNGDTGLYFASGNNDIRPFNTSTQNSVDNSIDLGRSATRFKDLYLSGGVYLGGTGSSNLLQDYEIGSWTPVDVNDTAYNTNSVTATYTKIGRIVYFNFDISSTGSTTGTKLGGLPFTAASSSVSNNWSVYTGYSTSNADICGHINAGTDEVNITVGSSAHTLAGRWIGAGFYYV